MVTRGLPGSPQPGPLAWLTHIRLSRLIFTVLTILITVPLVAHYFLSNLTLEPASDPETSHRSRELRGEEISSSRAADLRAQIEELRRIKASVNTELRDLESRRQRLHAEISGYNTHIETLKASYEQTRHELDQLKVTIENTRLEQEEIIKRNMPQVRAPHRVLPPLAQLYVAPPAAQTSAHCAMHTCWDHSRCSVLGGGPVYLYRGAVGGTTVDTFIQLSVSQALQAGPYLTASPAQACVYLVLVGEGSDPGLVSRSLRGLKYWNGDGRNHVLVNLARDYGSGDALAGVDTGRAVVVQSAFTGTRFRPKFDFVVPPSLGLSSGDVWDQLSPITPAMRKHLLTFHGDYKKPYHTVLSQDSQGTHANFTLPKSSDDLVRPRRQDMDVADMFQGASDLNNKQDGDFHNLAGERSVNKLDQEDSNPNVMPHFRNLKSVDTNPRSALAMLEEVDSNIVEALKRVQASYPIDNLRLGFSCEREKQQGVPGEWSLCGAEGDRSDLLRDSTFTLIIAPTNITIATTTLIQVRLYEALKHGAIPVVLGDHLELPFSELLSWKRVVIALPKARITELHFILRSITDADVLEMRRQGRLFWETYLGTTRSIVDSALGVLRARLRIPAAAVREEKSPSVFRADLVPLREALQDTAALQPEDVLGPLEAAFPSPAYRRNYTTLADPYNSPGRDPFHSYPSTPWEPAMPGDAKFRGSGLGFRPIAKGEGGAGREFSEALGGNVPREQFTVVMLTYEREAVLIEAIARLKGLPHLNKVLVVWNNPQPPADDLRWPEIGVEVKVIRTSKNSLNNRFLPYDAIETEAILSIDDDAHLRHDEIVFGFRVWRENRDRIVGFPGRFHSWDVKDQTWRYNSNYSCELSMVLTGAAFYHKYYSYLYSYVMPHAIRDKVDEYLNCEDLAMNFLVSHVTRKPPIKVTSRWTFRCPGCPNALSVDDSHFNERHRCIDFFVKVYGYMPLLNTQFRVDSVLFKTRIPHDKQKCFKFI